jgi:hypothetical protein
MEVAMIYDPLQDIDPDRWLALDEHLRLDAVEHYHRRLRIPLPNRKVHATIHVVVENQVALGDQYAAKSVLERLMREGLDRHEAIHAIASVLTGRIFDALKHDKYKGREGELSADYLEKLKQLTARSWRKSFE